MLRDMRAHATNCASVTRTTCSRCCTRGVLFRTLLALLALSALPVFIVHALPGSFAYHCVRIAAGFLGFGWCHPVLPARVHHTFPEPPSWEGDALFWDNFPCARSEYRVWLPEASAAGGAAPAPAACDASLVVSAYFDIGRAKWPFLARPAGEYERNMGALLALRNPLVLFTSPDLAEAVVAARRAAGLMDRTMVVAHDLSCASQAWLLRATTHAMCAPEATARLWALNPNLAVPERQEPWYNLLMYMKAGLVRAAASLPQPALASRWVTWLDAGCHAPMCPRGLIEGTCLAPARWARAGRVRIAQMGAQTDALAAMTPTQWTRQHAVLFAGTIFGVDRAHARARMDAFLDTVQWLFTRGVADYDQSVFAWMWARAPELFDAYPVAGNWHNVVRGYAGWPEVNERGE